MADYWFNRSLRNLVKGDLDFDSATLWCALVMTNTTADTNRDAATLSALTLDESDGTNYVRKALGSITVTEDLTNDRIDIDAADITWTALGNGTRQIQGYLIYVDADNDGDPADDAANIPVLYRDLAAVTNPGGSNFTIQWDSTGFARVRSEN